MNGGEGDAHELNGHSQDVDEEKAVQLVVEDDERHADGPDAGKTCTVRTLLDERF
jgi:hypothetical protein